MIKTFALIALLNGNAYTLDHDMSGTDCIAAVEAGVSLIEVSAGRTISAAGAVLACESEVAE